MVRLRDIYTVFVEEDKREEIGTYLTLHIDYIVVIVHLPLTSPPLHHHPTSSLKYS